MLFPISFLAVVSLGLAGDPDTVITKKTHTDAITGGRTPRPAQDATQTIWIRGKDKMRFESGERVTIVRLDEKKAHILNTKDKTVSTVDLPFDMRKYLPEGAPGFGGGGGGGDDANRPEVAVKATEETKKLNNWNAKKYTITRTGGRGGDTTETVWASKEAGVDAGLYHELMAAMPAMRPPGDGDPMKKVEGLPLRIERERPGFGGGEAVKSHEEITAIEKKEAPAGAFDVPADYTKKPFELSMMGGGFGGRGGRMGPGGGGAAGGPESRSGRQGREPRGGGEAGGPASKPAEKKVE